MRPMHEVNAELLARRGLAGTAADELLAARDVLAEHGWHQGDYVDENGKVCMTGAVAAAHTGKVLTKLMLLDEIEAMLHGAIGADVLKLYVQATYGDGISPVDLNDQLLDSEEAAKETLESAAKWITEKAGERGE